MTRQRITPNDRGQKRIDLIIMAVVGLVLAGCGASVASTSTTSPTLAFTSQSASAIVAQARAAMTAAGSVDAIGSETVKKSGGETVTATENDKSGTTAGSQNLMVSSSGSTGDISASFVVVDGSLYANANAAFWTTDAGATAPQAAALAGKWVQIPSTNPLYAKAASDLTMATLTHDLFDATSFHKGSVPSVDGVPAIKITYANGGVDAGPATTYVAVGGKHLPVSTDIGGLTLRMGSWGKAVAVSAPQGSVPLASVLATVPSGSTTT